MHKIEDYLDHAKECLRLAKLSSDPAHSAALHKMAQTWTDLAAARQEELERKKRLQKVEDAT